MPVQEPLTLPSPRKTGRGNLEFGHDSAPKSEFK